MKKYTMTYKNFAGALKYDCFEATTQREAVEIAKEKFEARSRELCGGFTLTDFYGNIIRFWYWVRDNPHKGRGCGHLPFYYV